MERKTMGAFIATLRKANGMTQRELAERLNVSDKSVSRWERDEGAPDLSLIPVIAELFGVTSDELLRGARKTAAESMRHEVEAPVSPKGERAARNLIQTSLQRYRWQCLISMGIALAGFIQALIFNLSFLLGYIGFAIGFAFYLASAICQWIFTDRTWLAVTDDVVKEDMLGSYRWRVFNTAAASFATGFLVFCSQVPLLLHSGAQLGLNAKAWLVLSSLFCIPAAVICCIIKRFLQRWLIRRGMLTELDHEPQAVMQRYRKDSLISVAIAIAGTLVAMISYVQHRGMVSFSGVNRDHILWGYVDYQDMELVPLLGLAILTVAAISQWLFTRRTLKAIRENSQESDLVSNRWQVSRTAVTSAAALFGVCCTCIANLLVIYSSGYEIFEILWVDLLIILAVLPIWYGVMRLVQRRILGKGKKDQQECMDNAG